MSTLPLLLLVFVESSGALRPDAARAPPCSAAYLHAPVPLAARGRVRDVWLLVGAAGCGVALLLLMLGLAGAALSQRSRAARRRRRVTGSATSGEAQAERHGGHGAANRRRHFHGRDNKGFLPDEVSNVM